MQVFGYRYAHNFPKRVFLPFCHNCIDPKKGVTDEESAKRLEQQAIGFIEFCNLLQRRNP
jgi:hypothetical protein